MPKLKPGTIWPGPAKIELTEGQIGEIAVGPMSYEQVEEKYGEEVAIEVGLPEILTRRSGLTRTLPVLCPLPNSCLS